MSRSPGHCFLAPTAGHEDHNSSKAPALTHGHIQARPNGFSYLQVEQNSRPGTPSMTTGSSRSATSSVITCEHFRNSSQQCGCHSDSDSSPYQISEVDSTQSPMITPASIKEHDEDAKGFQKSPFRGRELPLRSQNRSPQSMKPPLAAIGKAQSNFRRDKIQSSIDCGNLRVNKAPSFSLQSRTKFIPKDISIHGFCESVIESSNSDSEMDEAEDDSSEEGDYDSSDDNDWSGQNNNLEGVVLEALQGDLQFAAQLIPVLHKYFYSESTRGVAQKVSPWRYNVTKCSPGTGTSSEQTSSSTGRNGESTSNSRKRQRVLLDQDHERTEEQDEDDDNSEGDGNRRPKGADGPLQIDGVLELPRLACPFNKMNPEKYGIQHEAVDSSQKTDHYRACEGPGFKSIQRLKEHLKRKHYPVQCDRCYLIFHGPDRASCVLALQSHRQLATSCEREPDSLQEGISDAQWVSLDRKSSVKKNQQASRVEKWMEIWTILFPGVAKPNTPWYYDKNGSRRLTAPSQEVQRFAELFKPMLDLQVSQRHIRFLEGSEDLMKARVENLAQKAIALFIGVNGMPSSTDSSSARSRQRTSLLSGSYQMLSTQPTSRGHHSTSESRSTIAHSQGFPVDLSSTPTGPQTHRHTASSPGPAYLDLQHMASEDYLHNSMAVTLHDQRSDHSSYQVQLPDNVDSFGTNNFNGQDLGASGGEIFPMDFGSTPFTNYDGASNMQDGGYGLNDSLMGAVENGAGSWEQIEASRRLQYEHRPQ